MKKVKTEEEEIPAENNSKLEDKTITPCQSSSSRHAPKHPYVGPGIETHKLGRDLQDKKNLPTLKYRNNGKNDCI